SDVCSSDLVHEAYQKYVFYSNVFDVWNGGNVVVEPESMYLKIIVKGTNGNIKIKNKTTNQIFEVNSEFGGTLEVDGVNVKMNGVNILRDTNKKYISIAPKLNKFEITGAFKEISFDFRYYYK